MPGVSFLTTLLTSVSATFQKRNDVYILVMGRTGTGKTSFINTATESHLAIGSTLSSRTHKIQLSRPLRFDSKRVILIDTPGLDDTSRSTEDVIRMVSVYLAKMRKRGRVVQGTIYLHRISDNRMGQVALQSLHAFQDMCAQEALPHIAIVLSMWEDVSPNVREGRRRALCSREHYFKPLIETGAVALAYDRTAGSAHEVIQCLVERSPQTASVHTGPGDLRPVPVRIPASSMLQRIGWETRERMASPIVVNLDFTTDEVDYHEEKPRGFSLERSKDESIQASMAMKYDPSPKGRGGGRLRRIAKAIKDFLGKPRSIWRQRMTT